MFSSFSLVATVVLPLTVVHADYLLAIGAKHKNGRSIAESAGQGQWVIDELRGIDTVVQALCALGYCLTLQSSVPPSQSHSGLAPYAKTKTYKTCVVSIALSALRCIV